MAKIQPDIQQQNSEEVKKHWYVIYCKPNTEKKTASQLKKLGITVYCPIQIQIRQWSDRKKKVELPVLPSMLLVFLKEKERNKVFDIPSVTRYLFWLKKPAIVKEKEVNLLKKAISENPNNVTVEKIDTDHKVKLKGLGFNEADAVLKYTSKTYYCVYLERLGYMIKIKR